MTLHVAVLAALCVACAGCGASSLPQALPVRLPPPIALPEDAACYRLVPSASLLDISVSTVLGDYALRFTRYRGEVRVPHNAVAASQFWFQFDTRSLSAGTRTVAEVARSSAFLDVARFPRGGFSSRRVIPLPGKPQAYIVQGELSLHGVTRGIALPVRIARSGSRYVLLSHFMLDRGLFDIRAPGALDAMVHDQIGVDLQMVAEECQ